MKKTIKVIALCMAISIILISLVSCGVKKDDLVGTWVGEWEYGGSTHSAILTIKYTGYFTYVSYKNGIIASYITGDFEIKGNTVRLYDDSSIVHHGESMVMHYKGGKLVSGVSVLSKKS